MTPIPSDIVFRFLNPLMTCRATETGKEMQQKELPVINADCKKF